MAPTHDTIADGSYPLSRSLFIYSERGDRRETNATLKAFVDYYLTEDGLTLAVEEAEYIALPADRQEAARSAWESAVS